MSLLVHACSILGCPTNWDKLMHFLDQKQTIMELFRSQQSVGLGWACCNLPQFYANCLHCAGILVCMNEKFRACTYDRTTIGSRKSWNTTASTTSIETMKFQKDPRGIDNEAPTTKLFGCQWHFLVKLKSSQLKSAEHANQTRHHGLVPSIKLVFSAQTRSNQSLWGDLHQWPARSSTRHTSPVTLVDTCLAPSAEIRCGRSTCWGCGCSAFQEETQWWHFSWQESVLNRSIFFLGPTRKPCTNRETQKMSMGCHKENK